VVNVERKFRTLLECSIDGALEVLSWQADRLDPVRQAIRREILEHAREVLATVE
jgi:hypothetical protein